MKPRTHYLGILALLMGILALTGFVTISRTTPWGNPFSLSYRAAEQHNAPTPIPTQPPSDYIETQPSPDGSVKIIMHAKPTTTGTEYTFTTMEDDGNNPHQLYQITQPEGTFSLPFNAWSPDNAYVFIQKNTGEAYVFTRTGSPIIPDERFFDVREIYSGSERGSRYSTVTGWASPTLLIIRTVNPDGSKGSSYWFEVPSKAIIQLSGDF